jgi:hypothetical protein
MISAPQDGAEQPLPSRPDMVGELCCHGRAPMRDMPLVLDLQAAMSVTKIVQPHREPTHPAVIPRRFRKGQGLTRFALIAQATGPIMTLHHTRINDFVASEIQDMLQTGFAMHDPHIHPLAPTPFLLFFHLPIRQSLWPAQDRTPGPA